MKASRKYGLVEDTFMDIAAGWSKTDVAVMAELRKAAGFSSLARRSQKEVAAAVGVNQRTVRRSYAKLVSLDVIAVSGHSKVYINPRYYYKGNGKDFPHREKDYLDAKAGKWVPERAVESEEEQTERLAAE